MIRTRRGGRGAPPRDAAVRATVSRTSPFTLKAIATRVDDEIRRIGRSLPADELRHVDRLIDGLSDAVAVSLGERGVRAPAVNQVARGMADSLQAFLLPVLAKQAIAAAPTADGTPPAMPQGVFLDTVRLARTVVRLVEVLDPDAAASRDPPRRHLKAVVEALSGRAIAAAVLIEGALGTGTDHPDLRVIARALLRIDVLEWGIAEAGGKKGLASVRDAVARTLAAALGRATEVIDAYVAGGGLEGLTRVAAVFALLDDLVAVIDGALARCADADPDSLDETALAEAVGAFAAAVARLVRASASQIRDAIAADAQPPWIPGLVRLLSRLDELGRRFPAPGPDGAPAAALALLPREIADEIQAIADVLVADTRRHRTREMQALAAALLALLRRSGHRRRPEGARA